MSKSIQIQRNIQQNNIITVFYTGYIESLQAQQDLVIFKDYDQLWIIFAAQIYYCQSDIYNVYRFIISMPSHQKCCQCLNGFSMSKLPRKLPCCLHSICQPCLREIIETKQEMIICGFCSSHLKKHEIRIFSLNTALLLSLSSPTVVKQPPPIQQQNQLLCDLIQANPAPIIKEPEQELCPAHKNAMDIVCISDRHRICPHCAIFGNHKDHRFKRLDDFQKEIVEKKKAFLEIQLEKENLYSSYSFKIYDEVKQRIQIRKQQLFEEIQKEQKRYVELLQVAKEKALNQLNDLLKEAEKAFLSSSYLGKFEKSKEKMDEWQLSCLQSIDFINNTSNIEEKIYFYYEGPLEVVEEGINFIQDLNKNLQQCINKLGQRISQVQMENIVKEQKLFQHCFNFRKGAKTPNNSSFRSTSEDIHEGSPFVDFTNSEIAMRSDMISNTSLEAQISTLTKQINKDSKANLTPKKPSRTLKSIEKEKPRNSTQFFKLTPTTPKVSTTLKRPTSEISNYKFSPKLIRTPTAQEIIPQSQVIPFDLKQPERIYLQFSKNTLSDFFDLSQCNLPSDKVVQYVQRARRIHKIKGLKLSNNRLTTAGFEKMCEHLKGVTNINLADNIINEAIFDVIVKNREKLETIRMLNLSHNPIALEKRAYAKIQEIKRFGIIIVI